MAIDRRVERTRTALYDALVALIRRKDYAAITVQDILDEADVGRSTFYAHFTSKDDLLGKSLERLRRLLEDVHRRNETEGERHVDPCRALFEHVAEYADVQHALSGGRGGAVLREAVDHVLHGVLARMIAREALSDLPRDLALQHIVSTFNAVLRWWQKHPDLPAAEADRLFRRLVLGGVPHAACAPFIAAPA